MPAKAERQRRMLPSAEALAPQRSVLVAALEIAREASSLGSFPAAASSSCFGAGSRIAASAVEGFLPPGSCLKLLPADLERPEPLQSSSRQPAEPSPGDNLLLKARVLPDLEP